MNSEQLSIKNAYDTAASAYRSKYDAISVRTDDIDRAFATVQVINPHVLEIGCAYGREAQYILTKTSHYIGIDISQEYVRMAQEEIDNGNFICVDVTKYDFPVGLDIVFAFASLLHLDKENVKSVLQKIYKNLNKDGIIYLSLKRREEYFFENVTGEHTTRKFYYYNRKVILELTDGLYSVEFYEEQTLKEPWFTMILKKKNI
jgi:SAM-dependent methyltransferase